LKLKIVKYPNPTLNEACRLVTDKDLDLVQELIPEMYKTCFNKKRGGFGLAANQLGHPLQLMVMFYKTKTRTFINPKMVNFSPESDTMMEGCLSFNQKIKYPIIRWVHVDIEYFKIGDKGLEPIQEQFSTMEARIIQHEMDHLSGITMYDKWREQNE